MLAACLESPDATVRSEAAYAFRFLPKVTAAALESLKSAAERENISTGVGVYIVSAFCVQASRQGKGSEAKTTIKAYSAGNNDEKYELCACLASIGNKSDIPLLKRLLKDKSLDVRTSAANAILSITGRK
jgi:HEAT repeat protein